jgi:hypothetical protein
MDKGGKKRVESSQVEPERLAQMDRASASEAEGRPFEPGIAHYRITSYKSSTPPKPELKYMALAIMIHYHVIKSPLAVWFCAVE